MTKTRKALAWCGTVLIILSSAAHSILGWKQLKSELLAAHVPSDLIIGLKVGWQFGGVAMLMFGVILALALARDSANSVVLLRTIGAGYLAFGIWALWITSFDPFFAVFIVPAVLLLGAGAVKNVPAHPTRTY